MDYFNNKIICDLVEAPHSGIMAQLDEACYMVGKVNDKLFLDSLSTKLVGHKHFTSRKVCYLLLLTHFLFIRPVVPLTSWGRVRIWGKKGNKIKSSVELPNVGSTQSQI